MSKNILYPETLGPVSLPSGMLDRLRSAAHSDGVTLSHLVRESLRRTLESADRAARRAKSATADAT